MEDLTLLENFKMGTPVKPVAIEQRKTVNSPYGNEPVTGVQSELDGDDAGLFFNVTL